MGRGIIQPDGTIKCAACGQVITVQQLSCPQCNQAIDEYTRASQPSEETAREKSDKLTVLWGKGKESYYEDLSQISNILISGTTGSGKTAFVRSIMLELMKQYSPEQVRFVVYDSKLVDYSMFSQSPHLIMPICTTPKDVMRGLQGAILEVYRRLENPQSLSDVYHLFVILDDYSMIAMDSDEIRDLMVKLSQVSRTAKVHCFLITSTPTLSILSNPLVANIPFRVAFRTATKQISKMIIDDNGAETLRVPGEMIYKRNSERIRCNVVYYSDNDATAVLDEIKRKYPIASWEELYLHKIVPIQSEQPAQTGDDEYLFESGRLIIEKQKASIGMLQRVYRIGFNRAAGIVDRLTELGVLGPENGTKSREILMTLEQYCEFMEKNNNGKG